MDPIGVIFHQPRFLPKNTGKFTFLSSLPWNRKKGATGYWILMAVSIQQANISKFNIREISGNKYCNNS